MGFSFQNFLLPFRKYIILDINVFKMNFAYRILCVCGEKTFTENTFKDAIICFFFYVANKQDLFVRY